MSTPDRLFMFKAFLSHRYKSPEINLYFFNIFKNIANVQFEVDKGKFSTNVTRLERMIRDAHAFVGIYPYPGDRDAPSRRNELLEESRYFRLELDLAVRSGKPAIVFYDQRYGNLLNYSPEIISQRFDSQAISGVGGDPDAEVFREKFTHFCDVVERGRAYQRLRSKDVRRWVGVALPAGKHHNAAYTGETLTAITELLATYGWDSDSSTQLSWPPSLNRETFNLLAKVEWMIVDIGEEMASTGIPAFLHGQFIPTMRLKYTPETTPEPSLFEKTFYRGVEVGYAKDILAWHDQASLLKGLEQKLLVLDNSNTIRITNAEEAGVYFRSAAQRKEKVFLSYCNKDRDVAARVSKALALRFKDVFDYRAFNAIIPGKHWTDVVFDSLNESKIGIIILSEAYFRSKNCKHEAAQMVGQRDNQGMMLKPLKIYDNPLKLPASLQSIQYARLSDYKNVEDFVASIVGELPKQEG